MTPSKYMQFFKIKEAHLRLTLTYFVFLFLVFKSHFLCKSWFRYQCRFLWGRIHMLKPLIEGLMGFLKHQVKQNETHAFTFCF